MRYFLSAFLALNVAVATISGFYLVSEDERPPIAWAQPFALESDRSVGAGYAAILWLIVARARSWQLRHQPEKRLLWWRAGWVSCAILAVGIASDELLAIRDRSLDGVAPWHWIVVLMPALGPLTVCASSALWTVARRSPVTRQLLVTSGFLATVVLVSDAVDTWFRDQVPWVRFAEEGSELMLSAILIVVLVSWRSTPRHVNTRPLVFASIMALACVVPLAAYWDTALGIGWDRHRPTEYAGPLGRVEQSIHVKHDHLASVKTSAFVDVGRVAGVDLRIHGPSGVIRESHAVVMHAPWSDGVVEFRFAPIVNSGGQTYDIEVTRSGESPPYAFVGLSRASGTPVSVVRINGEPSAYDKVLAIHGVYAVRRGLWIVTDGVRTDPRFTLALAGVVVSLVAWLWPVWLTSCPRHRNSK